MAGDFVSRRSHLRPPQPLQQPQQSRRHAWAPTLLFVAAATVVLMVGLVVTR